MAWICSGLIVLGRCCSRRRSSVSAAARSRRRFSHSVSSPAGDQSIFGLHSPITTLGSFGLVACTFHFQAPLRQGSVMVGLELLHREQCRFDSGGTDGLDKSVGHGLLDRQSADVETVNTAPVGEILASTVVAGSRVSTAIVSVQTPAAVATRCDA